MADHSQSVASGWVVVARGNGRFQWSAYGPLGGEVGEKGTRADAERAARKAERHLSRSVGALDDLTPRGRA